MSLKKLLLDLIKVVQEIPSVEEQEVIEPEHHNLLADAISLIYEIVLLLSTPPFLVLTPAKSCEISQAQPNDLFIPLGQLPDARGPGLPLTFPCRVKELYVVVHSNNLNVNVYTELQKNGESTGVLFTIPSNSGSGIWGCSCDVSYEEEDCIRVAIRPAQTPTEGTFTIDMIILYLKPQTA
ncbi:MAG: hypothetical protein QXT26_06660 [Thermoproteota archaeon]